jgi:hypothetical protein
MRTHGLLRAAMLSLLVAGAARAQQFYPNELVLLTGAPTNWGTSGLLVDLDQDGDDDFVVAFGAGATLVVCHASGGTLHPGIACPAAPGADSGEGRRRRPRR